MNELPKKIYTKQSGFSLYMVLIIMIVIAFLVVATMHGTSTNSRTSANDSDYQFALQNAQKGLKAAQENIGTWPSQGTTFSFGCKCENGLCAAKDVDPSKANTTLAEVNVCDKSLLKEVWKRDKVFSNDVDDPSISGTGGDYRYVIEYLGPDNAGTANVYIFRITSKGWGKNKRTTSIVEETVQATLY